MEGVGKKTAEILVASGLHKVQDILEMDLERLSDLPGIGPKKAEKLLESAQRYIERSGT
jgi:Holliday junction resolvasome RuvABC DNA-binding subunit